MTHPAPTAEQLADIIVGRLDIAGSRDGFVLEKVVPPLPQCDVRLVVASGPPIEAAAGQRFRVLLCGREYTWKNAESVQCDDIIEARGRVKKVELESRR